MLEHSPLGKVPYLQTEDGDLCESQCIVEYLAARFPDKAIFSADPWEAAKERELIMFVDVHLELTARNLYKEAFFGGTVTEATKGRVEKLLNASHCRLQADREVRAVSDGRALQRGGYGRLCELAAGGHGDADQFTAAIFWSTPASTGKAM